MGIVSRSQGGGAVAPTSREVIGGNSVSIANTAVGALTWDNSAGPDSLLDRSAPAAPTVITTGVYAVAVHVEVVGGMSIGGSYRTLLTLDAFGEAPFVGTDAVRATTDAVPVISLTLTYHLSAGATITLTVQNNDGAASRDFDIVDAVVQRIS